LTLLGLLVVAAVVAIIVLVNMLSRRQRRRYGRILRVTFLGGLGLGLTLPWDEQIGLFGAVVASFGLLLLALLYYLLGGRVTSGRFLRGFWTPREQMRDWFLYFSIITGVTGIVSTILSVLAPTVFQLSLSLFIPLAFDSLSVLAALLDFSVVVPPYHNIYGLTHGFILGGQDGRQATRAYVEDLDFGGITNQTSYTRFEVRDALEQLVRRGFATKQAPTPLGKVRFDLNQYGLRYAEACWNELRVALQREKDQVEGLVVYLEDHTWAGPLAEVKRQAQRELRRLRDKLFEMQETYGLLLEGLWQQAIFKRVAYLEHQLIGPRKVPVAPVVKEEPALSPARAPSLP
jgi:hypothetical protein